MKSIGNLFGIVLMLGLLPLNSFSQKNDMKIIVAHRGAWKQNQLPQNSLASLNHAISLKLGGSEFDVQMTADDSLVINHDSRFNGLDIGRTSYKELVRFRLSNNEKIPTLREYITAGMINNSSTRLICELKSSTVSKERGIFSAEKLVETVRELKATQLISYISFDIDICKRIAALDPLADIQYLNGDIRPDLLKAEGINGIDYNISVFKKNPGWIDEAKNAKMILNAWTVNNPDDMDWLIKKRFDYITTDEPELLQGRISQE